MTIVRCTPGTPAPWTARYASVGHFGEPSGFTVWCEAGELLPPPREDGQVCAPAWYVEVAEVVVTLIAA
jgi:hypothetical protein